MFGGPADDGQEDSSAGRQPVFTSLAGRSELAYGGKKPEKPRLNQTGFEEENRTGFQDPKALYHHFKW